MRTYELPEQLRAELIELLSELPLKRVLGLFMGLQRLQVISDSEMAGQQPKKVLNDPPASQFQGPASTNRNGAGP